MNPPTWQEIAEALAAELDKAVRQRDSLARRCAVRYEEAEKLREELAVARIELTAARGAHDLAEAERDALVARAEHAGRVVEAAVAWRRHRNFEYLPGEINPHLLTAHQEDLDLARAVDAEEIANGGAS